MVVCYMYIFEKWFLQFFNFILLRISVAMSSYVQEKVLSLEVETEVTGTWQQRGHGGCVVGAVHSEGEGHGGEGEVVWS
jgi:hypothetical protein